MSASATPSIAADEDLLTYADLVARWKIAGPNPLAIRKTLYRRMDAWRLRPLAGTRGDGARFRMADVVKAEERAAGRRAS